MRIAIIEPHPDDAMLNLHGIIKDLLKCGHEIVQICMTAQQEDPRKALLEEYGESFSFMSMESIGINWTLKGRAQYKLEHGDSWNTSDILRQIFVEQNGGITWEAMTEAAIHAAGDVDLWLLPVGQIHPMHVMVREEFGRQLGDADVLLYREFPYWTRVRGTRFDQLEEGLGLEEVNRVCLSNTDLLQKYDALKKFYPLGTLYLVTFPHAIEYLREELVFTCQTTDF